jgi:hypothetical protein
MLTQHPFSSAHQGATVHSMKLLNHVVQCCVLLVDPPLDANISRNATLPGSAHLAPPLLKKNVMQVGTFNDGITVMMLRLLQPVQLMPSIYGTPFRPSKISFPMINCCWYSFLGERHELVLSFHDVAVMIGPNSDLCSMERGAEAKVLKT